MADATVLEVFKDWVWVPALGLISWAWKRNEKEHDDMRVSVSKINDHIDLQVKEVRAFVVAEDAKLMSEMGVQRGHIGKIFDKLEESSKRSEDRHLQLLEKISDLSTAMHTALSHKVDK